MKTTAAESCLPYIVGMVGGAIFKGLVLTLTLSPGEMRRLSNLPDYWQSLLPFAILYIVSGTFLLYTLLTWTAKGVLWVAQLLSYSRQIRKWEESKRIRLVWKSLMYALTLGTVWWRWDAKLLRCLESIAERRPNGWWENLMQLQVYTKFSLVWWRAMVEVYIEMISAAHFVTLLAMGLLGIEKIVLPLLILVEDGIRTAMVTKMDHDGWITPNKRIKLSPQPQHVPVPVSDTTVVDTTDSSGNDSSSTTIPKRRLLCQYGDKCYRKNAAHLVELYHPLLDKIYEAMSKCGIFTKLPAEFDKSGVERITILEQIRILKEAKDKQLNGDEKTPSSSSSALSEVREERRKKYEESNRLQKLQNSSTDTPTSDSKSSMLEKWERSRPYNFFLTKVAALNGVEKINGILSSSFYDLFDSSLGEAKALIHINFMVESEWFMRQAILSASGSGGLAENPTRIIFDGVSKEMEGLAQACPWIKVFGVKSPFPFGHHHTKMSIVQYTDLSIRFFIYTANLIESDWENRTQGIWISPRCPKLESPSGPNHGESITKFRSDIVQYLSTYPIQATRAWIDIIKTVDCSEIKVYLIASAPVTTASGSSGFQWGSCKMEKVLKSVTDIETDPSWPLVIQCSSIGTLGQSVQDWVGGELGVAFAGKDRIQKGPIHVVYPSHSNVKASFEGLLGGGCLPYSAGTHKKQTWLEKHLCQWKADRSGRSRAVPHIKSYFRIDPQDPKKLAWFLLTSANLSKAAWGKLNKNKDRLSVMSWEAGVLFVPQIMISQNRFRVDENDSTPPFPLHIDLPLVKYEKNDTPWSFEVLQALMLQN